MSSLSTSSNRIGLRTLLGGLLVWSLAVLPAAAQVGDTIHYFPQFAIGGGAVTVFTLYNPADHEIAVNLAFYRSDGTLFLSDSRTLGSRATLSAQYGGAAGMAEDGWAALTSLEPFAASVYFKIAGVGNVGVAAGQPVEQFQFFTFHGGQENTGFAVANPNPSPTAELTFRFFDPEGSLQGTNRVTLPPMGHIADFVDEAPYNFSSDGRVEVSSSQPVVAMTLRSEGAFLTSAPILSPRAAVGFTDWERVIGESNATIRANDTALVQATCPGGKRALGGGGWSSGNNAILVDSWPVPPGERVWAAIFWNHLSTQISTTIRAYAICATAP